MDQAEELRYSGDAAEYLLQIPMFTKEKHSLSTIRHIYERIGRFPSGKTVHIAGTNGKGSVSAFLTSMLKEMGYQVGTFTSPHLREIRERISFNGETISRRDFEHCFRIVLGDVRACGKEGISHPAFFEFLFYMAMVYFCEKNADYIILETGLGGRLDGTNICRPAVSVITSIGMDHMEYLGNTIEEIAGEKAGIIKPQIPVVFSASKKEAEQVIRREAEKKNAPCFPVFPSEYKAELTTEGILASYHPVGKEGWSSFPVPFPALYQGENAAIALRTMEVLGLYEEKRLRAAIEKTRWPGRMEQVLPGVYLDGAHNADGIQKFTETVQALIKNGKKPKLLFSVASDKEYEKMAKILDTSVPWKGIGAVHMDSRRGLDTERICSALELGGACPVKSYASVEEAFQKELEEKREDELLFCTGSLYFVGEIKEVLEKYGYH